MVSVAEREQKSKQMTCLFTFLKVVGRPTFIFLIFSCAIGPIIRKQCLRLNLVINYSFAKLTSTHTHLEKWCLSFIFSLEGIITEHFWPPCPFLKINTLIYIFLKNLNRDLFAHKNGYKQCPVGAKNLVFFPSFFAD